MTWYWITALCVGYVACWIIATMLTARWWGADPMNITHLAFMWPCLVAIFPFYLVGLLARRLSEKFGV